jgi:hypothetical protein
MTYPLNLINSIVLLKGKNIERVINNMYVLHMYECKSNHKEYTHRKHITRKLTRMENVKKIRKIITTILILVY